MDGVAAVSALRAAVQEGIGEVRQGGEGPEGQSGEIVEIRACAPGAQGNLVASNEWLVASEDQLTRFWHWLTTTRYTRLLEERVAVLEAENLHLRNSIYARAGIGPVLLATAPTDVGSSDKRSRQPIRRPVSWSQVKQKLESAASPHQQSSTSPRGFSS